MTWDLIWIHSMGNHGTSGVFSERRHSSCSSFTCLMSFVWQFVQAEIKGNMKALHHWPFVRKKHQRLVDSSHKGPVMQKAFPCHDNIMKAVMPWTSKVAHVGHTWLTEPNQSIPINIYQVEYLKAQKGGNIFRNHDIVKKNLLFCQQKVSTCWKYTCMT